MSELARSIEALAIATDYQAEELRRAREERARERWERPEFKAEFEARRRIPRKLDVRTFAKAIPGFGDLFRREVPPDGWVRTEAGAVVRCPCGGRPEAKFGVPEPCGCERWFLLGEETMRVAFSPVEAQV